MQTNAERLTGVAPADTAHSLARSVSPLWVVWATVIKELQIARRYFPDLIGRLAELGIRVGFFFLLSSVLVIGQDPATALSGDRLFIFFQGALVLFVFKGIAVWTPLNAVNTDLYNGTLEFLYSHPISRYAYYVGTVLSQALIALVVFLPLYVVLALYSGAGAVNMGLVLLVCLVTLVTLSAMGVMISLLALVWRKVTSIAAILDIAFEMIAGAYFPVTSFPVAVQYIAYVLPYTWGYDLVRYYSFEGSWATILPVWQEWALLVGYAVIYVALSRFLLGRVERHVKEQGLHLI